MRFLVTTNVFDTIFRSEDVMRIRQAVGAQLEHIQKSGKLVEGGMLADRRGMFLLVDVEDSSEFLDLLGSSIYDNFHLEIHPVYTFEKLAEFFKKDAAG